MTKSDTENGTSFPYATYLNILFPHLEKIDVPALADAVTDREASRQRLLNMAIDSDDGNPQLREKARRALASWLERLRAVIEEGQHRREIRGDIDPAELATLIVSTLEGSLMVSRLQRKDDPRDWACHHLEEYLENNIRAGRAKGGVENR